MALVESPPKKQHVHQSLKIFEGSYFAVPTFFVDKLMMPAISKGIPPSLWKMTFVLLREMLAPSKVEGSDPPRFEYRYKCKTTSEWFGNEYGIDSGAVQDWSNAYSVSGVFSLKKGVLKVVGKPGTPTEWFYNTKATDKDWMAFVSALSKTIRQPTGKRIRRHGVSDDGVNAADGFKIALAFEVDKQRARVNGDGQPGLPPVNNRRIEHWTNLPDVASEVEWPRRTSARLNK